MEIAEARERYAALKEKIDYHNHLYYDLDAPELDDYAYDALTRELKALEAEHPEFVNENSPTRHVCGVLDVVLHREDGSDEFYIYKLDEEERMVVLSKMEDYCVQRTGQTLGELCEMYLEPPDHPVMEMRMR